MTDTELLEKFVQNTELKTSTQICGFREFDKNKEDF